MRRFAILFLALSLSGCTMYSLEKLRHTTPSGTPFQTALSKRYMDFAAQGEKEYDWQNSWHFADKGLMLAYGKDMGPEDLAQWNIPKEARPDLEKAREALLAALTPETIASNPQKAADAQFYFDCWVKYQEPNWQTEEIAYCRDGLAATLQELHPAAVMEPEMPAVEAPKPPVHKSSKKTSVEKKHEAKKSAEKETPSATKTVSYVVFFEWSRKEITHAGKSVVADIIKSLKDLKNYDIVIRQHGTTENMTSALAKERAEVVKKQLVAGGIPEDAITIALDGVSTKPAGRRVEIFINE